MSKFYSELAKYYDYIFPLSDITLNFIEKNTGKPSKKILDVASGSGLYSSALSNHGYNVTAVDLDSEMIKNLRDKDKNIDARVLNMLKIESLNKKFDTIFCIGNSIVHLNSNEEILSFLKASYNSLNKGGKLIIQIINYDRVIEKNIKNLPTIKNKEVNLTFERNYEYIENIEKINFHTVLKANDETLENNVLLLPIKSGELTALFKEAGFKEIKCFGNFKEDEYKPLKSVPLVMIGRK